MPKVERNPSPRQLRQFGWAMLGGFAALGALGWYGSPDPNTLRWVGATGQKLALGMWTAGLLLLAVGLGPRSISRPIYVCWMTVAMAMREVMTIVILSVLYFTLLPIFTLIRLGDPLRLRLRPPGDSYWEDHRHHESTLERTARPF